MEDVARLSSKGFARGELRSEREARRRGLRGNAAKRVVVVGGVGDDVGWWGRNMGK